MTELTSIDLPRFDKLKHDMGDDFIGEMIDTYLAEMPKSIEKIRRAVAEQNADQVRLAAHSVKSSSANFGALQLAAFAKELEMLGKSNALDRAAEILTRLEQHFSQVALDLQSLRGA